MAASRKLSKPAKKESPRLRKTKPAVPGEFAPALPSSKATTRVVKDSQESTPRLDTTLVKGLSVLSALAASDLPLSISSLSADLRLGKSNVHRLLATLVELGFAQKDETRRYSATLKLWEMGSVTIERDGLRRAAQSVMRDLVQETGESVFLSRLSGTDVLYMHKLEALNGAHSASLLGLRVPAIFPASGRVLLAHQPEVSALVSRIIETEPQASRLAVDRVLKDFESIRAEGFATTVNGWRRGISSIAVPIARNGHPPVAAIGVSVLPDRYDLRQLRRFAPILFRAATRISHALGSSPGTV